jgi:hypothetical protein
MSIMRFKRAITILSASVLAGSMSMPLFAQDYDSYSRHSGRSWSNAENYSNSNPAARWQRFLDENTDFARRYRENPNIIRDPRVVDDEPGLRAFFANNPEVRRYAYNDRREMGRSDMDGDMDSANGDMSGFLATHPGLARQLRDRPGLINDPRFVQNHPNLDWYLRNHPDARY